MDITEHKARHIGGLATTGALLVAGHYFVWWKPLPRLIAYTFGVISILIGQGVFLRFNRRWRELCTFAVAGGAVVGSAYLYDWAARQAVKGARWGFKEFLSELRLQI